MKEDFEKFIKEKRNVVLLVMIGVTLLTWIISSIWPVMSSLSCIATGALCLDVAYLLFLKYQKKKNSRVNEFLQEENDLKTKAGKFVESESRMNLMLLLVMCLIMGCTLIFYGFKMIIA